ncbi:MAG: aspartate kinase, partial [Clostridia bacterium]|nr:aspartate kinase [Clostridia bacterium]
FITGITGKKNYSVVSVSKKRMSEETGYVRRVLEIFERYHLSIDHIPTAVDSFSVVLSTKQLTECQHRLIADIEKECEPDSVKVRDGLSLVAIVGRRMAYSKGVSGKVFATLGLNGINIRLIEQDADEIEIVIGVMNSDFEPTIRTLYSSFT